jgi:UDP-N-acetylmuramoylalanine--D-glutamate ligase
MDFRNRRVTVMGLGHFGGGLSAARWLARQGAVVTVTDTADEAALADSLAAFNGEPIAEFHLGGHREEDFRRAEMVVINPAVRPNHPLLQVARDCAAILTSETELFLDACPAKIIGVTGSNGKSTTAAMTAAILRAEGRKTWLGGNIGASLLDHLAEIGPADYVVLELSSFQLWHLRPDMPMPHVAVVTSCTPNHLDWHQSYEHYRAAKQRILTGQNQGDLAVLNSHDTEVASWRHLVRGRFLPPVPLAEIPPLSVLGEHQRSNAACAAAAAYGIGCDPASIPRGLQSFCGLPQRLELVAVVDGRRFYNDSTATTPQSTIAALGSLPEPIWLLAGGRNKGFEFHELAAAIVGRARGVACFGSIRQELRALLVARSPDFPCAEFESLAEALRWCWAHSRPGEAIVLSPACASTDQFRNFRQRGETFVELVRNLADQYLLTKIGALL